MTAGESFQAYGVEDGWLMIQYGDGRFGYIACPEGSDLQPLSWDDAQSAWLLGEVVLTDGVNELLTLPDGAWVTVLMTLEDRVYIESSTGDIVRGFVQAANLRYDMVFASEDGSATLTVSPDGHFTLEGELPEGASGLSLTVNGKSFFEIEW